MNLRNLLTELAAQITATGVQVGERSLPAQTRFTPEQIANAIRQKIIVSGYKIVEPLSIRTAGNGRYTITGQGINMMATVDVNGRVDLFQNQQQPQQQMKPQQMGLKPAVPQQPQQ